MLYFQKYLIKTVKRRDNDRNRRKSGIKGRLFFIFIVIVNILVRLHNIEQHIFIYIE